MNAYSNGRKGESLLQLSEEVSRIAGTLAQLSTEPSLSRDEPSVPRKVPHVSVETVSSVIRSRKLRTRYFSEDLFADPAWDIMLDLLRAEASHTRVSVSSLCLAAGVPATTALRWLKSMEKQALVIRRNDPHDGRRVFIELAPETSVAIVRLAAEDVEAARKVLALLTQAEGHDGQLSPPSDGRGALLGRARFALALRQRRLELLGSDFSAEPPFDILVALYVNEGTDKIITASTLAELASVPPSTILRWLDYLVSNGWVDRSRVADDARKFRITLAAKSRRALDRLFS